MKESNLYNFGYQIGNVQNGFVFQVIKRKNSELKQKAKYKMAKMFLLHSP